MPKTVEELESALVGLQEGFIDVKDHVAAKTAALSEAMEAGDTDKVKKILSEMSDVYTLSERPKNLSEREFAIGLEAEFADVMGAPIQIFKTGEFEHPKYGHISITPTDLQEMKRLFDENARGQDIPIDVDHEHDKGAIGWVKGIDYKESGDAAELWATPAWSEEGAELVKGNKFRYISPHFGSWSDPEKGEQYDNVLMSVAVTNFPFLKGMAAVEFSELRDWQEKTLKGDEDMETVKELSEALKATKSKSMELTEQNMKLTERLALVEAENRQRHFTEIVTTNEWVGDKQGHIKFMERLAASFGEDSDEFKHYVEDQSTHAAQLKESLLFKEAGSSNAANNTLETEAKITALAKEVISQGRAKSLSEAMGIVLSENPALYAAADKEHLEAVKNK